MVHPIRIAFSIPIGPGRTVERFVYTYLVGAGRFFLIDTGVAGTEQAIAARMLNLGRAVTDIDAIILTHSHPDHIGAAVAVKDMAEAQVWAHPHEQDWIENIEKQKQEGPVPGFDGLVAGGAHIDRFLNDGDLLHLGNGAVLKVLHTPGHSRGSISLLSEADGILFCGDAIPEPGSMPIYEDVAALAQSLVRLARIKNLSLLYSSWAEPVAGEAALDAVRAGIGYLKTIHATVMQIDSESGSPDSMSLCKRSVERLGLPPFAANPLVARSLAAHRADAAREALDSLSENMIR